MTCIAGYVEGRTVWIGGDSAGISGWDLCTRQDPKVFLKERCLFGFTSSFRMGQLLKYRFQPPVQPPLMGVDEYLHTLFIDAIRDCLKQGGYARKTNDEEAGGTFLLGYAGRLFRVNDDYQIAENKVPQDAIGCGAPYALGALYAMIGTVTPAQDRIRYALGAAHTYSAAVRGPFTILSLTERTHDD